VAVPSLVLASRSPQRRAILRRLGAAFTVRPVDVPELERGEPREVALENALRKARAAQAQGIAGGAPAEDALREERTQGGDGGELVLGCDTVVALDGVIYGKPADEREARATLRALSEATHDVISGLALLSAGVQRTAIACTKVTFRALDGALIDWYLATGEWRGRAGGYAIQAAGAALVRAIEGDYENVVGLPVATLLDLYPELLGP
jgi:nucleoside triphosphate pyrophosphatase